jgi:hypothetical protein
MKRSRNQLAHDEDGRLADDLLRATRAADDAQQRLQKRKKDEEAVFSEKWRSNLAKWTEMGLQPVSGLLPPALGPASTFITPSVDIHDLNRCFC